MNGISCPSRIRTLRRVDTLPCLLGAVVLVCFLLTILSGCGTGPWIVGPKNYDLYLEPVVIDPDKHLIRNDGYYLELPNVHNEGGPLDAVVFTERGHITVVWISRDNPQHDIDRKLLSPGDTIHYQGLGWWQQDGDTISLEHYGEHRRLMYSTSREEQGLVINDSTITVEYSKYRFVQTDSLAYLGNHARYLQKKWYLKGVHRERK